MSTLIRPRDVTLQEPIMTVFNKLLLVQDNALTASAMKKRDVNTPKARNGTTTEYIVFASNCFMGTF